MPSPRPHASLSLAPCPLSGPLIPFLAADVVGVKHILLPSNPQSFKVGGRARSGSLLLRVRVGVHC